MRRSHFDLDPTGRRLDVLALVLLCPIVLSCRDGRGREPQPQRLAPEGEIDGRVLGAVALGQDQVRGRPR